METLDETELCFPQLLNTSCRKTIRPHYESMMINVVLYSMSVSTTVLNLLVIISISHFKKLHTPTNFLLLSLAVSDFIVGLLVLFMLFFIDGCWYLGDLMCTVCQYVDYVIASAGVGTMVLISADRYIAICDPLHYTTKVTQKRVQASICLCWICSMVFQSLVLKDVLKQPGQYHSCIGECIFFINYIAGTADLLFTFIFPITVIIVLYMRVFMVAVSQARAMRSQIAAAPNQQVSATKSELKAARTIGVLVVVFLICLCPYYYITLTLENNLIETTTATAALVEANAAVASLYYFNSCLNPLIYAFFYPWFRKSIKLIVTLRILQTDSCEANIL